MLIGHRLISGGRHSKVGTLTGSSDCFTGHFNFPRRVPAAKGLISHRDPKATSGPDHYSDLTASSRRAAAHALQGYPKGWTDSRYPGASVKPAFTLDNQHFQLVTAKRITLLGKYAINLLLINIL